MERTFRARMGALVAAIAALTAAFVPTQGPALAASDEAKRIVLDVPPTASAYPAKPRAEFRAETEGSPQPTIVGSWSEEASSSSQAELRFEGGHAVGQSTSFLGNWISPATTSSKSPTMTIAYEIATANLVGRRIPMIQSIRARFDRGRWGPWVIAKNTIQATETKYTTGSVEVVVPLTEPRRVQFQWKVAGTLRAYSALVGNFQIDVS